MNFDHEELALLEEVIEDYSDIVLNDEDYHGVIQVRNLETHQTLADCLMMIRDCNDLYLSDTRKLDNVFWKLKNEFNLEEK